MKRTFRRGLLLALVTTGWLCLSAWMLLADPGPDRSRFLPTRATSEEPPQERSLWDRLSEGATSHLRRHDHDPLQEALTRATTRLGAPAWHEAGFRGKGVKIAILDSGFRGY